MKLQRLAGYGPTAAFVSAAALIVFTLIAQVAPILPSSLAGAAATVYLIAIFIWVAALAVVVLDLEWLEHPATSTPWIRVALVAVLVAAAMPLVFPLLQFVGFGVGGVVANTLLQLGVGISVLVHNIEGRRTGLLRGALPWVGMVFGAGAVLLGILNGIFIFTTALVPAYSIAQLPTEILYVVWAIWLGVRLSRSRSGAPAATPAL